MILTIHCPYCNNVVTSTIETVDFNRGVSDEKFTYLRCSECGLVFLQPVPPNIGSYYQSDYYDIPENIEQLAVLSEKQKHKLRAVQNVVPQGRLLEIGPSYGDFVYLAKQAGYDVTAIEMNEKCCLFLRTQLGIEAFHSDNPADVLKKLGQYDVIALWHVIEHLPSPWTTLNVLAEHLAPNGILVIAAPNPTALEFRIFGPRWAHLDAPRHLQLIPTTVLEDDLKKVGLAVVQVTTNDGESIKANTYGWKKSIMNALGVRVRTDLTDGKNSSIILSPTNTSAKYLISRTAIRILVALIEVLLSPIERTGLRGSSYTMIFQKKSDTPIGLP